MSNNMKHVKRYTAAAYSFIIRKNVFIKNPLCFLRLMVSYYMTLNTLLVASICTVSAFSSSGKFFLVSVSDYGARIGFELRPAEKKRREECLLAFSTIPQKSYTLSCVFANGVKGVVSPLEAGWAGDYFLQWFKIICSDIPYSDSIQKGVIDIGFGEPLYRGVSQDKVSFKNGILRVPVAVHPLKKTQSELTPFPFTYGLKIEVDKDGIYEITASDLKSAGVPIERIESRYYRLFEKDREVPLYITNPQREKLSADDRLLFYGHSLRASARQFEQFSFTNVYWLTWDGTKPGSRVAVVSGGRRADPTVYASTRILSARNYYDTIHIEEDNSIVWLGNIADRPPDEITGQTGASGDDIDNWYWGIIGATALTSFNFNLQSPSVIGNAGIRASLMGLSSIDSLPDDHDLEIFINDRPCSIRNRAVWDGQREFVFESDTFPAGYLTHGENRLTFRCRQLVADRSALNWIEVIYPRGYESLDDKILFKSDSRAAGTIVEYTLSGFGSDRIELWDITRNRFFINTIIEPVTGKGRRSYTLVFQDSISTPATYLAQTTDKRLSPGIVGIDTIRDIWENIGGVDYIAVGPDSFKSEIAPLLDAHKESGLRTAFVNISDIYNRFSWGIRNPESIRLFLRYILSRFGGRLPRYLLLAGDTTHDLDKKNRRRNIVPTHLSRIPGWGPGADDGYFAIVNEGDQFPDLAVGRFPAQNRSEMRRLVDRTVRYIRNPHRGYWRDNLLLLGGGENVFTRFNDEATSEIIGKRMHIIRMDADPASRFYKDGFVAPQLIADYLNTGAFIVNFNGHGGGNIWSDNNFFGYNDLYLLHNGEWGGGGRLPIVFSFTCLTGFFESSEYRSLGEEFLRSGDNGAVAFYGASSYTSRSGNLIMNKLLLDEALTGKWDRLGDLISYCEISMLVRYYTQYLSLVNQYNLLGDPALPLVLTPDTLALDFSLTDSSKQLLEISGTCLPVQRGEVRVSLESDDAIIFDRTIARVVDGNFSVAFRLKEAMKSAVATIRAYAWNDGSEVRGWKAFVKDTLFVYDVRLDPPHPYFGDSVSVSCELSVPASQTRPELLCLFAQAAEKDRQLSFGSIAMVAGNNGRWFTVGKIPLHFKGSINENLLLRFRVAASQGALQTGLFTFSISGKSDLAFIDNSLRIGWVKDSLRTTAQVINKGNAVSPPFKVAFLWTRPDGPSDTFAFLGSDSLPPGNRRTFSTAIPDTQGSLSFCGLIIPSDKIPEIESANNRIEGSGRIFYCDMSSVSDTLSTDDRRLLIFPRGSFGEKRRLFLFEDTVGADHPLPTQSRWIAIRNNLTLKWYLTSRPAPGAGDSIIWLYNIRNDKKAISGDSLYRKVGFMLYDTLIGQWRYIGGIENISSSSHPAFISMTSALTGTFSLASIADATPPEIMVSVYGKTLDKPDYTAQNRPFTVFLSDPSGILPYSVELFCNNRPIPSSAQSSIPFNGDLRSITLTIYPEAQGRVDSLIIHCSDLAGNPAKRSFVYLPGSDLSIRSFSCHPNPFTAKKHGDGTISLIRFAFLLTDVASTVTLSVYTVSGKKIKTWSLSDVIGYRQIEWDGRDFEGFRIANGTYYAKLIAKNDRKKVYKIIRIAKLEGF